MAMGLPFNPFEGMGDLGMGQPQAVGNTVTQGQVGPSEGDLAAADWLAKRQAAIDATKAPAPADQGPGGAILSGLIASILAGATGAGVQASAPAAQGAQAFGMQQIQAANDEARAAHAARIKQAADAVTAYDDLTKGARMLLQAQPKLFQGEDLKLISAIAFPDTGLSLASQLEKGGINPATSGRIEALKFAIRSGDIRDKRMLAGMQNELFSLMSGKPYDGLNAEALVDPLLGVNTTALERDTINGAELLENFKRTGVFDLTKVEWKASVINETIPQAVLNALHEWAKLIVDEGLSDAEALKQLAGTNPEAAVLLQDKFGPERVGGLPDLSTMSRLAQTSYLRQGTDLQALSGGLGEADFFNKLLTDYTNRTVEDRQNQDAQLMEDDIDATAERIQQEDGLGADEALEQARELVIKKPRWLHTMRNTDPAILKRHGIGE